MTQPILITGGTGQIGRELARLPWPDGIEPHFPDRHALDLTRSESIADCFTGREWVAVINCAAYTAVDRAESETGAAFLANAQGPAWLADATRMAGIPLIHVSTDYVFGGGGTGFYQPDAPVSPIGVYGASKLAGELAVRTGNPRSVILRTAWVLSAHRSNFLKTMLRVGAAGGQARVVSDQYGCPTSAADVATALQTILLAHLRDEAAPTGIHHFVNSGEASWCDLARTIFDLASRAGGPDAEVVPIRTVDYPTPALRPANSRLSTATLTGAFGIVPRPWEAAVSDIIAELVGPISKDET